MAFPRGWDLKYMLTDAACDVVKHSNDVIDDVIYKQQQT